AIPVVPQLIRFAGSRNSLTDSAYRMFPTTTSSRENTRFRLISCDIYLNRPFRRKITSVRDCLTDVGKAEPKKGLPLHIVHIQGIAHGVVVGQPPPAAGNGGIAAGHYMGVRQRLGHFPSTS